jgi:hypothetical protein
MANKSLRRRTFGPVIGGAFFIGALFGALWLVAKWSSSHSQDTNIRLGDTVFNAGKATDRARSIEKGGAPLFFQDLLLSGNRDIYVNHLSVKSDEGWVAFAARVPGSDRKCTLVFPPGASAFTDPCTKQTWPADGTGLPQYPVTVTATGQLQVDLSPGGDPGRGTSTTVPTTTSTR